MIRCNDASRVFEFPLLTVFHFFLGFAVQHIVLSKVFAE